MVGSLSAKNPVNDDAMVAWLQRFVRFPSEQSPLQESDPAVRAFISDCVAPLLQTLGLGPVRFDPMGNLILELGAADPAILFVTYAMTHPASSMRDPFSAELITTGQGPSVRGRGVAEQKTALVSALAAVARVHADLHDGGIQFAVLTSGETGRHDAVASMMEALETRPDYAVICLGTDGAVGAGNKGRIDIEVSVLGRAAHSSMPWKGVNAITGACRCIDALTQLDLRVPDHPVYGPATLTPTSVRSYPEATHTVQDRVELTFDRRLLPSEDPDAAFADIAAALPDDGPWQIDCRPGPLMYPNETPAGSPLMRLIAHAYEDAGLGELRTVACSFALDAGYFSRMGIQSVMLGPGEIEQFHSSEEQVLVSDMIDMARLYEALIRRVLAAGKQEAAS